MKKLATLALVAASALTVTATAATAQPYRGHDNNAYRGQDNWVSINQRQAQLQQRIDRGVARGDLTRREAYRLQGEMRQLASLESRYRVNGLSGWERADLDKRFDRLASRIRFEKNDREQYGSGYRH